MQPYVIHSKFRVNGIKVGYVHVVGYEYGHGHGKDVRNGNYLIAKKMFGKQRRIEYRQENSVRGVNIAKEKN
jgi:hypothetical protein